MGTHDATVATVNTVPLQSPIQHRTEAAEQRHRLRLSRLPLARTHALEHLDDGTLIATSDDASHNPPRHYLMAFIGNAVRPSFHYYYASEAHRAARITSLIDARTEHLAGVIARREERKQPHTLKIGDILCSSWGYEQTNVDFYQVIAVRGAVVDLRKIGQEKEYDGDMTGFAMPKTDHFIGSPLTGKRPSASNAVRITSFALAMPWDGRRQRWTNYA